MTVDPTFEAIKAEHGGYDPTQLSNIEWSPPSWEQARQDKHRENVMYGQEAPTAEDLPWLTHLLSTVENQRLFLSELVAGLRDGQSGPDTPGSPDAPATDDSGTVTDHATGDVPSITDLPPMEIDSTEVEATQGGPEWDFPVEDTPTSEMEVPDPPTARLDLGDLPTMNLNLDKD